MKRISWPRAAARRAHDELWAALAPPRCSLCEARSVAIWCEECEAALAPRGGASCALCAAPIAPCADDLARHEPSCDECLRSAPLWGGAWAMWSWEGELRRAWSAAKYQGRLDLCGALLDRFALKGADAVRSWSPAFSYRPLVVPVPMHWASLMRRGWSPAEWIGGALSAADPELERAPYGALRRPRWRPKQAGLDRRERAANVRATMRASPAVEGRDVVLVDDVLTTGATASEACRALLEAGALSVHVVTLARAAGGLEGKK